MRDRDTAGEAAGRRAARWGDELLTGVQLLCALVLTAYAAVFFLNLSPGFDWTRLPGLIGWALVAHLGALPLGLATRVLRHGAKAGWGAGGSALAAASFALLLPVGFFAMITLLSGPVLALIALVPWIGLDR